MFVLFESLPTHFFAVSACTKLLVAEAPVEIVLGLGIILPLDKIVGGVLLPFYVFVPLWRLRVGAASAKAAVEEAASEEGPSYSKIKAEDDGKDENGHDTYNIVTTGTKVIGGGKVSTYEDSLSVFSKKAIESKINEVTPKETRKSLKKRGRVRDYRETRLGTRLKLPQCSSRNTRRSTGSGRSS